MRRNLFKKTLAFLLAGVLLISATGCSNGKEEVTVKEDTSDMIYEGKEIVLEGIEGVVDDFLVKGEKLYFKTSKQEDERISEVYFYSANLDGSNVEEIKHCDLAKGEGIKNWTVNADNNILYVLRVNDYETKDVYYHICKLDEKGNELYKNNISESLGITMLNSGSISDFLCDAEGRIVVFCGGTVYVLDENANSLGNVELGSENVEQAAKTKEGKIIFTCRGKSNNYIKVLDTEHQKWGKKEKVPFYSSEILDGAEYDLYYKEEGGIYGYNVDGKESKKLVDYLASNMLFEDTTNISLVAKDKFIGLSYVGEKAMLMSYDKVDPAIRTDKKIITLGGIFLSDELKKAAIQFNRTNNEYKIEFVEYSEEEDAQTKMNADIIAGKAPDIIDLSDVMVENYVAKGILEDLTPYYEKDAEINAEDMVPSVLEAMKTDGKLYYASPYFSISSLIGKAKIVGDRTGWTFNEMKAALEKKGDDTRPFLSISKMETLYYFLLSVDDFVDWKTGECSFDSTEFKEILEMSNAGANEEPDEDDVYKMVKELQEEKALLFYSGIIPEQIPAYEKMFGENVTFIGCPSKDREGTYFDFGTMVGISSQSEMKDGAWEFIRTLMTKEYQATQAFQNYDTPTRSDCFEMMMKAKMTTTEYVDEFGQTISPIEATDDWGMETEIGPLSKKNADMYRDLVNRTKKVETYNLPIIEIIEEEVQPYFAGDKNVDETAKIIQGRVTTYINENKW